jgi:hypothetical protein
MHSKRQPRHFRIQKKSTNKVINNQPIPANDATRGVDVFVIADVAR